MVYSERCWKPQGTLLIRLSYPLLCSWLPSTAPFFGYVPPSAHPCLPVAPQYSLAHVDSMFRLDVKESSIVSSEVGDQLRLDQLPTSTKPPNSLGFDFCHMSDGGNIQHCLCPTELSHSVT